MVFGNASIELGCSTPQRINLVFSHVGIPESVLFAELVVKTNPEAGPYLGVFICESREPPKPEVNPRRDLKPPFFGSGLRCPPVANSMGLEGAATWAGDLSSSQSVGLGATPD